MKRNILAVLISEVKVVTKKANGNIAMPNKKNVIKSAAKLVFVKKSANKLITSSNITNKKL